MEEIYLAGGCLWGVQEFIKYIPGVISTEAGRANGASNTTQGNYDGYAECVRLEFDPTLISIEQLIEHLFEIIDPYSVNKQGQDVGTKYRTGIYSNHAEHLRLATAYLSSRCDAERIAVEVLPLKNYVKSDTEHQHRLTRHPEDHALCHIPWNLLHKYKTSS
ncbi:MULTISPECIES: peptide-methionine (S)-S-oxide reductase [unclassified Vibrio]|uniref:peptide-methionine (S)-S-oxide reductase n=1 Tax=unclassified Vibrio TaxID=2614977 RepID=UPI0013615BDA|nr:MULTISPECIES: peptide-methionine (S)-S-oxide reductase [unclassified Vibrio]NAW55870.1 peptide-methionine (S)-S-oxide reductase [Vibrio sp. V36_P2S2PM302]NAX27815.1 peptide-methionine (S)-S-oxide reductase [Vibrio sp. V38_P2S17PM301]NAX29624.1 peptide-methionine (S)-S-oxide reductase [Vibrio sp. V37_P2S8PM304]